MKKLIFEIGGKTVQGYAVQGADRIWIHTQGETFSHALNSGETRERGEHKAKNQEKTGEIRAPMPGKVAKVFVRVGDSIAAQKDLLMLEAMKMEYSLKAPFDGELSQVLVKEGEQVVLGQVLAIVEKAKSK